MPKQILGAAQFLIRILSDCELELVSPRGEWLRFWSSNGCGREDALLAGLGWSTLLYRRVSEFHGRVRERHLPDRRRHIRSRHKPRDNLFNLTLGLVPRLRQQRVVIGLGQVWCQEADGAQMNATIGEKRQDDRKTASRAGHLDSVECRMLG
jgi:hypothetical protein